jgi:SAM-dependent methyltransferase
MLQFDRHAAAYDAIRHRISYPEALYRHLAGLCPGHDGAIDLGCGNGVSTARLVPYFRSVTGVDHGAQLVDRARRNHPSLAFHCARAEAFDAPAQVDLVTCATAFYWMDRDAVIARCAGWLRDGGVFCAYRYDFPVVYGPAREVVDEELALRWSRWRDPRLTAYDDTRERLVQSGFFPDADRFVVPNILTLSPQDLALFFLSTSYVTRFVEESGDASYADTLVARITEAAGGAQVHVNFDIHAFAARRCARPA